MATFSSIPMSEQCTCSLQARLHHVENARSREMKAHGELVRELESELESRRTSEAEHRLTVAKLRADKCRLEAEVASANSKARQLLEQLDTQCEKSTKREDEFNASREESEHRLQTAHEKIGQLAEDKRQLNVELGEFRARLEAASHENKILTVKNEELVAQGSTQVVQIEKLTTQVASKQQEIEAITVRSKILLEELANFREQQNGMHGRIQELERVVNRALVTRNRALQWRRKRQELQGNRLLSRRTFLTWKSTSIQARLQSAAKMTRRSEETRVRLRIIEKEVFSRVKEELSSIRQTCASERARIQSLRDEICQTELPKLLVLLHDQQKGFETQRGRLELQLKSQRESIEREHEWLEMSRQDAEHRVQRMAEAQTVLQKRRQHAILQAFAIKRHRETQRRTFSAWKEFYLRSVVGQATHTAMVFKSQQPSTAGLCSPIDRYRSQSWTMPATIEPVPVPHEPPQFPRLNFDDLIRSPVFVATTPIDTMWRRWRRIDAGRARRGNKHSTSLPS